jgi:hypothetical protein
MGTGAQQQQERHRVRNRCYLARKGCREQHLPGLECPSSNPCISVLPWFHGRRRGLELCEAMLTGGSADQRELLYLVAVSKYRQKRFIECRRSLKSLLEVR